MAGNALKGTQDRPLFRDILPNVGHWPAIGQQNKGDNHILLLFVHFSLSDFAAKNLLHNFTLIHIGRCQNANDGLTENFFLANLVVLLWHSPAQAHPVMLYQPATTSLAHFQWLHDFSFHFTFLDWCPC